MGSCCQSWVNAKFAIDEQRALGICVSNAVVLEWVRVGFDMTQKLEM